MKIQELSSVVELPVYNENLIMKKKEVEVEKIVYTDRIQNKVVVMEQIEEVERKFAVNVVNTQYQVLNKIVEKIVEIEDDEEAVDETGKEKCMSSSSFIKVWNSIMKIKFGDNEISDVCLTDEKFLELIVLNLQRNQKAYKAGTI